jgi:patatin-like phospholipase/acyl hydrolase
MTFAIGFINTVENFVGNEVKIGNLKGKVIINSYMKENMKLLEE